MIPLFAGAPPGRRRTVRPALLFTLRVPKSADPIVPRGTAARILAALRRRGALPCPAMMRLLARRFRPG